MNRIDRRRPLLARRRRRDPHFGMPQQDLDELERRVTRGSENGDVDHDLSMFHDSAPVRKVRALPNLDVIPKPIAVRSDPTAQWSAWVHDCVAIRSCSLIVDPLSSILYLLSHPASSLAQAPCGGRTERHLTLKSRILQVFGGNRPRTRRSSRTWPARQKRRQTL